MAGRIIVGIKRLAVLRSVRVVVRIVALVARIVRRAVVRILVLVARIVRVVVGSIGVIIFGAVSRGSVRVSLESPYESLFLNL